MNAKVYKQIKNRSDNKSKGLAYPKTDFVIKDNEL